MKVVGIVCSPRTGGNTETLIKEALTGAAEAGSEVELISLSGKAIAPCDGCRSCVKTGECHIKDDMQEIYKKLQEADGIIIGTPVYFTNVSAQAKLLIDRTYALLWSRRLAGKVGSAVAVARRQGCGSALSSLYNFFTLQGMFAAWGTAAHEPKEVRYGEKEGIRREERIMAETKSLGKTVVNLATRLAK